MFRILKFVFCLCMLSLLVICGDDGGGDANSGVTVSFSPTSGAANVAVSGTITATFSGAVNSPSSWSSHFTLKKNNSGNNLCTGYSASADGLTITCSHSDLETASTYTLRVSGINDTNIRNIDSGDSSFTTVGYTPVGGTVTLTGTLSAASASISSKGTPSKGALEVTSYKVLILNDGTSEQTTATVSADGSFSLTAIGGTSYMINFLNNNNDYVGTLETGTVSGNKVSVGLVTGGNGTTTNIGTISANVSTGKIISSVTLASDSNQLAYASNGVIAGGTTGEGSEDYTTTVGANACTSGAINCPDLDHDGVPDILDTDNNNNTYADQIDGLIDKCIPGTTKLYVENYPTCTGATCAQMNFPTPTEVDANIGQLSMYTINLEFTPGEGSSIGDYSYIQVTTPAYIGQYGYVYSDTSGEPCFNNVLWEACNGQKLKNYASDPTKFKIKLAEPPAIGKGAILENIKVGDTFVFNIVKTDGTTHTCTRKIGIIQKYYPYAVTYGGTAVPTSSTVTSWPATTSLNWSLAAASDGSRPKGMTYQVKVYPYSSSSGNCIWDPNAAVVYASGQDATSANIAVSTLPSSSINMWGLELWATDEIGDVTKVGPFSFTTAVARPCN